jgi:DNA gyrase/topoisomerase IV subunit B
LTSSNYDDDQKKLTGGRNGYGAKLANIYSSEFSESTRASPLTCSRRNSGQGQWQKVQTDLQPEHDEKGNSEGEHISPN